MSITKTSPKPFLGASIPNTKVLSTKIDEIIDQVNTNETDIATNSASITTINSFDTADVGKVKTVKVTLTATEIVGNAAGDIGHASGATLVAAPGAGYAIEFISALFVYDFATAAYTGGGDDVVVEYTGSTNVTSAITSANLLGAAGDKILRLGAIATEVAPLVNTGLSLSGTAYTQPGTAAGVLRCYITYRVLTTNL
jgi:hypothetical protein